MVGGGPPHGSLEEGLASCGSQDSPKGFYPPFLGFQQLCHDCVRGRATKGLGHEFHGIPVKTPPDITGRGTEDGGLGRLQNFQQRPARPFGIRGGVDGIGCAVLAPGIAFRKRVPIR